MIRSCLIAPLVQPLIASRFGRRTGLSGSRLAATALCLSALAAVTTYADATRAALESASLRSKLESNVVANAHRLPEKVAPKVLLERFLNTEALVARREDVGLVAAPALSPDFLQIHNPLLEPPPKSRVPSPGSRLSEARRIDRLTGGHDSTFLLFGSGQHRSGIPTS